MLRRVAGLTRATLGVGNRMRQPKIVDLLCGDPRRALGEAYGALVADARDRLLGISNCVAQTACPHMTAPAAAPGGGEEFAAFVEAVDRLLQWHRGYPGAVDGDRLRALVGDGAAARSDAALLARRYGVSIEAESAGAVMRLAHLAVTTLFADAAVLMNRHRQSCPSCQAYISTLFRPYVLLLDALLEIRVFAVHFHTENQNVPRFFQNSVKTLSSCSSRCHQS